MTVLALFTAMFGLAGIVAGAGMLRGKAWARRLGIGYSLFICLAGIGLILLGFEHEAVDGLLIGVFVLGVGGYSLNVLRRADVKAYFARTNTHG